MTASIDRRIKVPSLDGNAAEAVQRGFPAVYTNRASGPMTVPPQQRLDQMLAECEQLSATDLHLTGGELPYVRCQGQLRPLGTDPIADPTVLAMASSLMTPQQLEQFETRHTVDIAYSPPGSSRFRINVFRERGRVAVAIRRLEEGFRSLAGWNLPPQLDQLAQLRDGLVLVTGPTGSGKTTTLATLLNDINRHRSCHIVTIEDPVEYIHHNQRSLVHQRELYTDVPSFAEAVRSSLREDPDVILVGEMRDNETIQAAITAAETGHLVFSTLHTSDAVGAIDRMIGVFSSEQQRLVRQQVSMVLRAVVAQRLLPTRRGHGRVPAVECLQVTNAVAHLIRTEKSQQIYSLIEAGSSNGMQTFEQSLAELVVKGLVDEDVARRMARVETLFTQRLNSQQHQGQFSSSGRSNNNGHLER